MLLFLKRPLLFLKHLLFGQLFVFCLVVWLFENLYAGFILLLLRLNVLFCLILASLLLLLVFFLLSLVDFLIPSELLFFFAQLFLKLDLLLLLLFDVRVLDCLDNFVKFLVFRLLHFAELAKPGLLELNFVCIVFFNSLAFGLVLELQFVQFLYLLLFHPIDFIDLLVVFYLFNSLSFRNLVVELIDQPVIQLFSLFVRLLLLLLLLSVGNLQVFLVCLEVD